MNEDQSQAEKTRRTYQSIRLPEAREHVRRAGQYVLQAAEEYQPVVHRAFSLRRKIGTVVAAALAVWLFFHVVLGANGALAWVLGTYLVTLVVETVLLVGMREGGTVEPPKA